MGYNLEWNFYCSLSFASLLKVAKRFSNVLISDWAISIGPLFYMYRISLNGWGLYFCLDCVIHLNIKTLFQDSLVWSKETYFKPVSFHWGRKMINRTRKPNRTRIIFSALYLFGMFIWTQAILLIRGTSSIVKYSILDWALKTSWFDGTNKMDLKGKCLHKVNKSNSFKEKSLNSVEVIITNCCELMNDRDN